MKTGSQFMKLKTRLLIGPFKTAEATRGNSSSSGRAPARSISHGYLLNIVQTKTLLWALTGDPLVASHHNQRQISDKIPRHMLQRIKTKTRPTTNLDKNIFRHSQDKEIGSKHYPNKLSPDKFSSDKLSSDRPKAQRYTKRSKEDQTTLIVIQLK